MSVLCIDPGLATCGIALFSAAGELLDADAFATVAPPKRTSRDKGAVYALSLAKRGGALATWLRDKLDDASESVDEVIVEGVALGSKGSAAVLQPYAAGVIDCAISEAVPVAHYVTPLQWRRGLGWTPEPRPKGATDAQRAAAKKRDDVKLYAMIAGLRGAADVAAFVYAHGRRASLCVHAIDAFAMGRWYFAGFDAADRERGRRAS